VVIAVCVRWVDLRPEVDALSGEVATDDRTAGFSPADQAALEVATRLAEEWDAVVRVVAAGPPQLEAGLLELAASVGERIERVVRLDLGDAFDPAVALADAVGDADLVICGDHSLDGGSGATPAFVAHHLGAAQALGLVAVDADGPGRVLATRRLGAGRAERLAVTAPAVLSVEGGVARLRRASLGSVRSLAARGVDVVAATAPPPSDHHVLSSGPWRPRARTLPPPSGTPRERIVALTGALVDRTPPRVLEVEPDVAAAEIIDQLREWGYLA